MSTIKTRFNNRASLVGQEVAHDEFLNSLKGEVPLDILAAEEEIEAIQERHDQYLADKRQWYMKVLNDEFKNQRLWVQPDSIPQWYDEGRTYAEDPGYFKAQLSFIEGLVQEAKGEVATRIAELEAVADSYFPEHDREYTEIDLPSEGEAFMSYLKDTIDNLSADMLVTLQTVADDLRCHNVLNLKDYLTAEVVVLDRLNRRCYDERAGWYWDLKSAKERLGKMKDFSQVAGEETSKGMAPMQPDEAADLILRAKRMAGANQSDENVMACLEVILEGGSK